MGHDPYQPIIPAVLNVLCLPAASIRTKAFENYVSWLQTHVSCIPCVGSASDSTSPTKLLLNYGTDLGPNVLRNDHFFEPNRHAQIVLGLIDGTPLANLGDSQDDFFRQNHEDLRLYLDRHRLTTAAAHILVIGTSSSADDKDTTFLNSIDEGVAVDSLFLSLQEVAFASLSLAFGKVQEADAELPVWPDAASRLAGANARADSQALPTRAQASNVNSGGLGPVKGDDNGSTSPGRLAATGLLSLQRGNWSEALGQLTTAAKVARDVNDPAWHAKALEGLLVCMILLAWTGADFNIPQDCYPSGRSFTSPNAIHAVADANRATSDRAISARASGAQGLSATMPGLIATIINLYEKASLGYEDGLPMLLNCEAKVRLARLLIVVRRHGETLNTAALDAVVGHHASTQQVAVSKSPLARLNLQPLLLSNLLIESTTEAQARLPVQSAIPVYLAVCHDLATLGLERKLGLHLKEVLQKLPQSLLEARKVGAAKLNSHASSAGAAALLPTGQDYARIARGVRSLLQQAIRVYDLPEVEIDEDSSTPRSMSANLTVWLSVIQSGDVSTKLEILRLCIRVSDALPDWLGSVHFMSLLLFASRQSLTVAIGGFSPGSLIPTEEQTRLLNGIQHTSSAAQKMKLSVMAPYWDDFLVRRIALHVEPSTGKLMPHSSQDLTMGSATSSAGKRDPFIYNPFSESSTTTGPSTAVKGEQVIFDVLLQNPLEVDVEVEKIALKVQGCEFEPKSHSVVLGPLCVQRFTMKGVALEAGSLVVVGCTAQIKYCRARDFEIFDTHWQPPKKAQQKFKKSSQHQTSDLNPPTASKLEILIVDTLPQVSVRNTDLIQNSVMLLDGETCRFQITLENSSTTPADLVLFSYQDSVTRQLQEALSAKDLQPTDIFELQHQLAGSPAIRRVSNGNSQRRTNATSNIDAHSTRTFDFEILGKAGLTDVTLFVDYTHLGKPRNEVQGTFYTRQLKFPVSVTVNASVDFSRCNILSIPANHQIEDGGCNGINPSGETGSPTDHQPDQCLLQLDLRSIWPHPLDIKIETSSPATDSLIEPNWTTAAFQTLQPGMVDRALIALPKIFIEDPFAPIPSLDTKRQFVVTNSHLTLEAEMATRESFWYREHLCRHIRLSWHEPNTSRHGTLDIRKGIRLSARMIDSLKIDHVQISFSLQPVTTIDGTNPASIIRHHAPSEYLLKRSEFARLVVCVHNLTNEELKLLLRLQPSIHKQPHNIAMDLAKKFLWTGALQQVLPGGNLGPKDTREAELGIVVLVKGSFEVNATVEEVRSKRREVQKVDLGEVAGPRVGGASSAVNERRIWHARRPCLIHVVDEIKPTHE